MWAAGGIPQTQNWGPSRYTHGVFVVPFWRRAGRKCGGEEEKRGTDTTVGFRFASTAQRDNGEEEEARVKNFPNSTSNGARG